MQVKDGFDYSTVIAAEQQLTREVAMPAAAEADDDEDSGVAKKEGPDALAPTGIRTRWAIQRDGDSGLTLV